jgi:hypothetical protein
MYVVVYKERVILGIIPWNNKYIMDVMRSRYNEIVEIPKLEPDISQFPYYVNGDCVIYSAEEDRNSSINPMIEYYYGPTWEFLETKVIAHYEIKPLSLEDAKNNYKDRAANLRYEKEISPIDITINGVDHKIGTDRLSVYKFIEKMSITSAYPINWKFKESWQVLYKEDLQYILDKIADHIQNSFDEELSLCELIDSAESVFDLLAIEVLNVIKKDNLYDI